jgi:hypothetical protein
MANEIVNTFKELVDRLKEANQAGGILERVKLIEGPTEYIVSDDDLPCIVYEMLTGGFLEEHCLPRHVVANMTVLLTVYTTKRSGYYDTETQSGILDYYQKIMNVVNGTTAIELKGNNHWGVPEPKFRVN